MLFVATILFLVFLIFQLNGYWLKGQYTFTIISLTFIGLAILYFVLLKNTKWKITTVFLLTPVLASCILAQVIGQVVYEQKIDETNKISVTTGGFLSCGESIHITQTRLGLFDKEVYSIDNLCLSGINKIEAVKLDDKSAEFLIYHNGQYDSENPYKYGMERKNDW